ncbi:YhhN-like protein [Clostridium homopropionicum DSM 5847]|uniref:YhhN-like protein n=1 Tax=Clostridium homopropionicum DSM 5847 TaxID=1121318 RepID=A0A0L6Z9R3_9CLOT|nr:YhhN-like protein [Clostridium homopropionicum DSM 5847]SFF79639.1 YhhN-like protein [Clostridium homopropionicum]
MLKSFKIKNPQRAIFFASMAAIYFLFIFFDLYYFNTGNSYSITLKYSSIIVFFILSLSIGENGISKKDTLLLQLALFFTLCADTCLLILNNFFIGVSFFCIVQFLYILRHSKSLNISKVLISLCLIIFLPICTIKLFPLYIDIRLLTISTIYLILLVNSLLVAVNFNQIVALAMTLFFFCDINVGISHILSIYPVYLWNIPLSFLTSFLVWIFYFPSQLLLALSGFKKYFH